MEDNLILEGLLSMVTVRQSRLYLNRPFGKD